MMRERGRGNSRFDFKLPYQHRKGERRGGYLEIKTSQPKFVSFYFISCMYHTQPSCDLLSERSCSRDETFHDALVLIIVLYFCDCLLGGCCLCRFCLGCWLF